MVKSFKSLELDKDIEKSLEVLEFTNLTQVQEKVIPKILDKKDVVVKSQTGSGKTLAFAVPICSEITWDEKSPQCLVVTPTRELAMQISEDFFNIGRFKRLKVVKLFGDSPFYNQKSLLSQRTHVVVGTPGRIIDHIKKDTINLEKIEYLVLDEADEMLNMGFIDQVEEIINYLPSNKNTFLFSATMPKEIETIYNKYLKNPEIIEIKSENRIFERVKQFKVNIGDARKLDILRGITIIENPDRCIIFCNTRDNVDYVYNNLKRFDYSVEKIHGGMDQKDRTKVMNDYKDSKFRYLIATDVAARGIDVDNITHVINYDIPFEAETYIHRLGRTGRMDKMGCVISLFDESDNRYLKDIYEIIDGDILDKDIPDESEVDSRRDEFFIKMNQKLEKKEDLSLDLEESILKIHINSGKRQKLRSGDIVGAICSIDGIDANDIGIITVIDTASFVEILNGKGKTVLKELKSIPIKGRVRKVNKARD